MNMVKYMQNDVNEILRIQPKMIDRAMTGWLAVSPDDAHLRIGVTASTEKEARELFSQTLQKWNDLFINEGVDQ